MTSNCLNKKPSSLGLRLASKILKISTMDLRQFHHRRRSECNRHFHDKHVQTFNRRTELCLLCMSDREKERDVTWSHLIEVSLAPPAVVSMTLVVRLTRRSSSSKPSSSAQYSRAVLDCFFKLQPPGKHKHTHTQHVLKIKYKVILELVLYIS